MQIIRKQITGSNRNATCREFMDALVALNVGFVYDETTGCYPYKPDPNMSDDDIAFDIDIANRSRDDANWNHKLNDGSNYKLYLFDHKKGMSNTTYMPSSQMFGSANSADYNNTFDYINIGNTLLFNKSGTGRYPAVYINSFFAAPVSEDDDWYYSGDSYVYFSSSGTQFQRPWYSGNNHGAGNNAACAVQLGKFFDGYKQRFADNLYVTSIKPVSWENGYFEAQVGDKRFLCLSFGNGSENGPAFDITDYIEEE